jgi:hypothetical protein
MTLNKNVNTLPGVNRLEDVGYDQDQEWGQAEVKEQNQDLHENAEGNEWDSHPNSEVKTNLNEQVEEEQGEI